jgi:hypothetical protein
MADYAKPDTWVDSPDFEMLREEFRAKYLDDPFDHKTFPPELAPAPEPEMAPTEEHPAPKRAVVRRARPS